MQSVALDDFMALNDELAALVRAGIPLSVEFASSPASAEIALQKINAHVARQVSQGTSIPQALTQDSAIPASYRGLMLLALESGEVREALAASHHAAESTAETQRILRLSLVYPAIVIGLAYLGLVGMCLFFVPVLANLYQSMQLPAGTGLNILLFLRESLPYWVALPPLLLILLAAWFAVPRASAYPTSSLLRWWPGLRKALFLDACATFADALATLLDRDVPLPDALPVAAEASREPILMDQATALASRTSQGSTSTEGPVVGQSVPPFLRWALLHGGDRGDQSRALRAVARVYRESARRRAERLRIVAPLVTCVVIGGSVTLLYGLALFLPMVELLRGLA